MDAAKLSWMGCAVLTGHDRRKKSTQSVKAVESGLVHRGITGIVCLPGRQVACPIYRSNDNHFLCHALQDDDDEVDVFHRSHFPQHLCPPSIYQAADV